MYIGKLVLGNRVPNTKKEMTEIKSAKRHATGYLPISIEVYSPVDNPLLFTIWYQRPPREIIGKTKELVTKIIQYVLM
jgi:hypothetical protein